MCLRYLSHLKYFHDKQNLKYNHGEIKALDVVIL